MFRSVAISRIQQGLGFRTDLVDPIIAALQEAQREYENGHSLPWFMIQEDATITITSGTQTVALPTGFKRMVETEGITFTSTDDGLRYLEKKPFDEAKVFYSEYDAGEPLAFSLRKASLYFWPEPDANYTATWSYYKAADTLDVDIENVWLANVPDLLIGRAGMIVAADLENTVSFQKFDAMHTRWRDWLYAQIADREDQGMQRAMGVNF
jgi:hypothetical protein